MMVSLGIASVGLVVLAGIFFVLFGQITMRKLRKNPRTKDHLGVEFHSGWDIVNAASALSLPRRVNRWFRRRSLGRAIYADAELLYEHTNIFDRILARLFHYSLMATGALLLALVVLDQLGFSGD